MQHRLFAATLFLIVVAFLLASCGVGAGPSDSAAQIETPSPVAGQSAEPEVTEVPGFNWNQLLSRDSIRPIYEPEFVTAGESGYDDEELVMGVAIKGEAKAYSVSVLNSREMVNDELAGTPILVTW
jgi:hypothetical protein